MVAVTSPRKSSSHRLASPLPIATLENFFPSASTQTSGWMSPADLKVLPNQPAFSNWPFILWPVRNSPPFHSPIMPSIVAGCRVAQNSSSSASAMSPLRSLNSANILRARLIELLLKVGAVDPVAGEPQQGVVFLRRPDGDPDTVRRERADHDPRVGSLRHEVRGARAQRQPDEVGLRRRQGVPGVAQTGGDAGALGDDGVGAGEQLVGGVQ